MRTFSHYLIFALVALVVSTTQAVADGTVWSFEDKDGVAHFSNVPDGSPYRLYLKDPGSYRLKPGRSESSPSLQTKTSRLWTVSQDKLPFAEMVAAAAIEQQLDPALLHAIIHVESRHNPATVSSKGAIGLMQVLPATAKRMGVDTINTPAGNISAGARYMRFLLDIFGKDVPLALAAYNAGENAVIRYGNRIPPYPETLAYVPAVIAAYHELLKRNQ
jgi:soluble lytic murein transglycosylase-like protein